MRKHQDVVKESNRVNKQADYDARWKRAWAEAKRKMAKNEKA